MDQLQQTAQALKCHNMKDNYDYINPEYLTQFMIENNIIGDRGRALGKPSVRKLAELAGCNYTSLNQAMIGKRQFSEVIKAKLHHFIYKTENDTSRNT